MPPPPPLARHVTWDVPSHPTSTILVDTPPIKHLQHTSTNHSHSDLHDLDNVYESTTLIAHKADELQRMHHSLSELYQSLAHERERLHEEANEVIAKASLHIYFYLNLCDML